MSMSQPSAVVKTAADLRGAVEDLASGRIVGRWSHKMIGGRPTGEPGESVVMIEGAIRLDCGSVAQVAVRISGSQLSAARAAQAVYVPPRGAGAGDAAARRAAAMAARDAAIAATPARPAARPAVATARPAVRR